MSFVKSLLESAWASVCGVIETRGGAKSVSMEEVLEAEYNFIFDGNSEKNTDGLNKSLSNELSIESLRKKIHSLPDDEAPWALCLSGGGIRSATFSLGVLQGLAERGLLKRFTYLSTVSGGGYIGSWLSRWIEQRGGNVAAIENLLKGGTARAAAEEPEPVRSLRSYSNYLSPVWGLSADFFTLVSTVLRNLLLNWCVLVPLIAATLLIPYLYVAALNLSGSSAAASSHIFLFAVAGLAIGLVYIGADLPATSKPKGSITDAFFKFCFLPIVGAAILLSIGLRWIISGDSFGAPWLPWRDWSLFFIAMAVAGVFGAAWRWMRQGGNLQLKPVAMLMVASGAAGSCLLYLLGCKLPILHHFSGEDGELLYATIAVPSLLVAFWIATTLYVALVRGCSNEGEREWWARSGGWWLQASLIWAAGFTLVIYAPQWVMRIPGVSSASPTVLISGGLWGVMTGFFGYWSKNRVTIDGHVRSFVALVGDRLLELASSVFILATLIAMSLVLSLLLGWGQSGSSKATQFASTQSVDAAATEAITAAQSTAAIARVSDHNKANSAQESPSERGDLISAARSADAAALQFKSIIDNLQVDLSNLRHAAATAVSILQALSEASSQLSANDQRAHRELVAAVDAVSAAAALVQSQLTSLEHAELQKLTPLITPALYSGRIAQSGRCELFAFLVLLVIGFAASCFVGVNTFSLHSMYGNRLTRAYLGAARPKGGRTPHWFTGFDPADNIAMSALKTNFYANRRPLFHVVNLSLNLVRAAKDHLNWQQRKATSFTVTPLHSGSDDVGFVFSNNYALAEDRPISLARAMTISGAAASPNMGYHSSPAVSFVMALLNVRLGWWLPNPGDAGKRAWSAGEPGSRSLWLLLSEVLGLTTDHRQYVYLSDGGHFENLGLYEMVRRRCRRILVVDAAADPNYCYRDLQDAIRKIRIDFGISITFSAGSFDHCRRYIIGTIRYSDVDRGAPPGEICYLKPTLFGDEPIDVLSYAAETSKRGNKNAFPQQSTMDQFFTESQFESYRMLGYHMTSRTFKGAEWPAESAVPERRFIPGCEAADARQSQAAFARPAPATDGALSHIVKSAQGLSQGAILASAVTVGGVLGVSGSIALKPGSEITISQESLDELGNRLKFPSPGAGPISDPQKFPHQGAGPIPGPQQPSPPGAGPISDTQVANLAQLIEEISRQAESIAQSEAISKKTEERLGLLLDALEKRIRALELRPSLNVGEINQLIEKLKTEVSQNTVSFVSVLGNPDDKAAKNTLLGKLTDIQEKLKSIKESVQEVPPRRNIHGVEGDRQ